MHILPYTNGIYNMDVNTMDVFTNLGRQLSRQLGKEEEEVTWQLRQKLSVILKSDFLLLDLVLFSYLLLFSLYQVPLSLSLEDWTVEHLIKQVYRNDEHLQGQLKKHKEKLNIFVTQTDKHLTSIFSLSPFRPCCFGSFIGRIIHSASGTDQCQRQSIARV